MAEDTSETAPLPSAQPAQSRTEAFGQGTASPGLEMAQQRQNMGPKTFTPNGTNMQLIGSGMGSAPEDQQRMLLGGGFLPTPNGMSAQTYQATRPFLSTSLNR